MTHAHALDVLLRAGARLGHTQDGRLVVVGVPPELMGLADAHAVALALATFPAVVTVAEGGSRSKRTYRWRRCDACRLEVHWHKDRACPVCPGKMVAHAGGGALVVDGVAVACVRPGCERLATILTHTLEPLCDSDFTHLALANEHRRCA